MRWVGLGLICFVPCVNQFLGDQLDWVEIPAILFYGAGMFILGAGTEQSIAQAEARDEARSHRCA